MKVVSEETKRKISESLKRYYAKGTKTLNKAKEALADKTPLGAKETIKREIKNIPGKASYEARKAIGSLKSRWENAKEAYNTVKKSSTPEEAVETARALVKNSKENAKLAKERSKALKKNKFQ